jgi:hypothetical protein
MKKRTIIASVLALQFLCTPCFVGSASESESTSEEEENPVLVAQTADEWNALFDQSGVKNGWQGADGIYSVALDGNDSFGSATSDTNTFLIFSDTILGSSRSSGKISFAAMPNHTAAVLKGNLPDSSNLTFYYGEKASMALDGSNLFGLGDWMLDCFVVGDTLYIFGFAQSDWKPTRIDLFSVPIVDGMPDFANYSVKKNVKQLWSRIGDEYLYSYGIAVTCNTVAAGQPDPDGYLYIYGYRDDMKNFSEKDMIVSRIAESDFPNFSKLEYYEGDGVWGTDIEKSALILKRVSCEFSVTPIPEGPYAGKYIAIYTQDTQSSHLMYAIGDSLVGPFDEPVEFYTCPETGNTPVGGTGSYYTYNAKAHPHLSVDGKLLVSYNVNVNGVTCAQNTADYRPRFVTLDLQFPTKTDTETVIKEDSTVVQPSSTVETESTAQNPSSFPYLPVATAGIVALLAVATGVIWFRKKKKKS